VVSLILVLPGSVLAIIFMRKSNYFAKRVYWRYSIIEKQGRFRGHKRVEGLYRVLKYVEWGSFVGSVVPAVPAGYFGYYPSVLLPLTLQLIGLAIVLLLPTSALYFLTRSGSTLVFEDGAEDKLQFDEDV